eukprot:4162314-Alexandrium_andersonii.AAC.1
MKNLLHMGMMHDEPSLHQDAPLKQRLIAPTTPISPAVACRALRPRRRRWPLPITTSAKLRVATSCSLVRESLAKTIRQPRLKSRRMWSV